VLRAYIKQNVAMAQVVVDLLLKVRRINSETLLTFPTGRHHVACKPDHLFRLGDFKPSASPIFPFHRGSFLNLSNRRIVAHEIPNSLAGRDATAYYQLTLRTLPLAQGDSGPSGVYSVH
jgi:hypothetical protein